MKFEKFGKAIFAAGGVFVIILLLFDLIGIRHFSVYLLSFLTAMIFSVYAYYQL